MFCDEYLQPSLCLMLQSMLKRLTVKDVTIANYELLNIQACPFNVLENAAHPISSGKLQVLSSYPNIH